MTGKIVVVSRRRDRIEEIVPYLENIARPGMRVVFLVPYPVDSSSYLSDHWITTESVAQAKTAGREVMGRYSWDFQRELAGRKIALAEETLRRMEIEVDVRLYTGSLKGLLRACKEKDGTDLMLLSFSGAQLWKRVVGKFPWLGLFKRPRFSPVMLLHV